MAAYGRKAALWRESGGRRLPAKLNDKEAALTALTGRPVASMPSRSRCLPSALDSWPVLKRLSRRQQLPKLWRRIRQLLERFPLL